MALFNFSDSPAPTHRTRAAGPVRLMGLTATSSLLLLGGLLATPPAAAEECKFAPFEQIHIDIGIEPLLLIDATCIDPDYNENTFVIDKTEELTFQVPNGG